MTWVWATCLVALACSASAESPDHYDYYKDDLYKLEEAIFRVASEQRFLRERATMLQKQKEDMDHYLLETDGYLRYRFTEYSLGQYRDIIELQARIKDFLHTVSDLSVVLAGNERIANLNNDIVIRLWERDDQALVKRIHQDAQLDVIMEKLDKETAEVKSKSANLVDALFLSVNQFTSDSEYFEDFVNTRKCYMSGATVSVDPATAVGMSNITIPAGYFPNGIFQDSIPTTLCGITGFESALQIDDKAYNYEYPDEIQSTAVTVDCEAQHDVVFVRAFDQSRGKKNAVSTVNVEVSVCSFAAESPRI